MALPPNDIVNDPSWSHSMCRLYSYVDLHSSRITSSCDTGYILVVDLRHADNISEMTVKENDLVEVLTSPWGDFKRDDAVREASTLNKTTMTQVALVFIVGSLKGDISVVSVSLTR